MSTQRPPAFRGRARERAVLDRLLDDARGGRSAALVIRGEVGVGKTALLRYAARQASGFRLAEIAGVEPEMELAYAGLHQLCAPMLGPIADLSEPQRAALSVAFGLTGGDPPDRFLVALATLNLLAAVAHDRPLLCLVDDAYWLDDASVQVLGFVARRMLAEPVAMLFAVRGRGERSELVGVPELTLDGLDERDARALLDSALAGPIDARIREQIVTETRGNPLALLELVRGSTPEELAGGFGLPGAIARSAGLEAGFRRRLEALPADTRRLIVLAAADPVGEPLLVWRGAQRLGIPLEAAGPAAEAGLLEFGAQVRFRHPVVRSAAYRSATPNDRQAAHRALAEATDPRVDPDRRAWHLAQAQTAPDESVAAELERSAARAQSRGGLGAAAAFLERAATLSVDPSRRAARLLAAAVAKRDAGSLDAAALLLSAIPAEAPDELARARVDILRGQIAFDQLRCHEAARLLEGAAGRLKPAAGALSRSTRLEALGAAMWAGERDGPAGTRTIAEAALLAPPPPGSPRAGDVLLDALALLMTQGHWAAGPSLRRALEAVLEPQPEPDDRGQWAWFAVAGNAVIVALELWDAESWHTLAARREQLARDAGALRRLQFAVNLLAWVYVQEGDLNRAALLLEEGRMIAEATGNAPMSYTEVIVAAWRGQESRATELIEATTREAGARGLGRFDAFAAYGGAVLYNGLGRHLRALDIARTAFECEHVGYGPFLVPELAEAAARTGEDAVLASLLVWLTERTRVTPSDWSLGIEARIRALMSDGATADELYQESIERLGRTPVRVELARAHLLYGEWLRRENRRLHAREQLGTSYEMLSTMGADAFAERARRELLATGETVRRRSVDARDELTAQERQIAELARDGLSNPEIGARLFLSPRTVEWHLRKVFGKLGISSRRELRQALPSADKEPAPA
jgi:DNA-binding CsgD family transcriptional regulator